MLGRLLLRLVLADSKAVVGLRLVVILVAQGFRDLLERAGLVVGGGDLGASQGDWA